MIRASALGLAELCGYSVRLAEEFPEGSTAATKGSDWHERMAAQVDGKANDPALATTLATMPKAPKREAEVRVSLADPDDGELISRGTADLVLTDEDGSITVVDWKTGNPDKVDEPDGNLQLLTYGLGLALERGAPRFRVGLYFTEYPPLRLSKWFVDGQQYWDTLARIKKATTLDRNTPVVGQHCDRCYRRKHCSAWLLPVAVGADALAPFTKPNGLTTDNALRALAVVRAMKDAIDVAEARLRDHARANGGIKDGGKIWGPVPRKGRRSISLERVEEAGFLPQLEAAGLVSAPGMTEAFTWRNAKIGKETGGAHD